MKYKTTVPIELLDDLLALFRHADFHTASAFVTFAIAHLSIYSEYGMSKESH